MRTIIVLAMSLAGLAALLWGISPWNEARSRLESPPSLDLPRASPAQSHDDKVVVRRESSDPADVPTAAAAEPQVQAAPPESAALDAWLSALAACVHGDEGGIAAPDASALPRLLALDTWNSCQKQALLAQLDAERLAHLPGEEFLIAVNVLDDLLLPMLRDAALPLDMRLLLSIRLLEETSPSLPLAEYAVMSLYELQPSETALRAHLGFCTRHTSKQDTIRYESIAFVRPSGLSESCLTLAEDAIAHDAPPLARQTGAYVLRRLVRERKMPDAQAALEAWIDRSIEQAVGEGKAWTTDDAYDFNVALVCLDDLPPDPVTLGRIEGLFGHPNPIVRRRSYSASKLILRRLPVADREAGLARLAYAAASETDRRAAEAACFTIRTLAPDPDVRLRAIRDQSAEPDVQAMIDRMLAIPRSEAESLHNPR